ncbi:NAD(+) diphosphatase [Micrococcoides hystricis]|uniref:NAD(+) diphosphatase n=1 Tax=Micrococcoides hystricis TaxID=1572761 RepID=A0ABV6PAG7_9MICC
MSAEQPKLDDVFGQTPLGILPLSRGTADRNCMAREELDFLNRVLADERTRALIMVEHRAPVDGGELALVPVPAQIVFQYNQNNCDYQLVYLGKAGGADVVLIPMEPESPHLPDSLQQLPWLGLRDIAAALDDDSAGFFVEALAIHQWLENSAFCPRCGSSTTVVASGWVRTCDREGRQIFPRTDPAVICAIVDDTDRILLGAAARWGGTRFSTLAGFVEPGESLEGAVVREIKEEANLDVADPQYLGSQPWPFPRSLMLGFTARALNPEQAEADGQEILAVRWFSKAALAEEVSTGRIQVPGQSSIARKLIEHWYGGPLPEATTLEN